MVYREVIEIELTKVSMHAGQTNHGYHVWLDHEGNVYVRLLNRCRHYIEIASERIEAGSTSISTAS
jgi:hypothetical protein